MQLILVTDFRSLKFTFTKIPFFEMVICRHCSRGTTWTSITAKTWNTLQFGTKIGISVQRNKMQHAE